MWSELNIHVDGFNPQDGLTYAVHEEIEHHFYVVWRAVDPAAFNDYLSVVNSDRIKKGLPSFPTCADLPDDLRAYGEVLALAGKHGKTEYANLSEANKHWSMCMARQQALF